jgi:hypothetical protein
MSYPASQYREWMREPQVSKIKLRRLERFAIIFGGILIWCACKLTL